jgi:hypothetical protein
MAMQLFKLCLPVSEPGALGYEKAWFDVQLDQPRASFEEVMDGFKAMRPDLTVAWGAAHMTGITINGIDTAGYGDRKFDGA